MPFKFSELLTTNAKLKKGSKRYSARGVALAPHKMSGKNLCPSAGACAAMCVLWFAGRTVMRSVRNAMLERSRMFLEARQEFYDRLISETEKHVRQCGKHAKACVRLNVASDLPWERIFPALFDRFPTVSWYDYTKIQSRIEAAIRGEMPRNYSLTYSINERTPKGFARHCLEHGINVSLVVDAAWNPQRGIKGKIPATIAIDGKRFPTIDGDEHDVRIPELDGVGVVVVLRGKGGIAKVLDGVTAGFVRRVQGGRFSTHEFAK